jgi:DNA (cytosine-5)-methyltransferase 1
MRGDFESETFVLTERGRDGGSSLEYRNDGTANAILTPNGGRNGFGVGAIAHCFDAGQSDVCQYGDQSGALGTDCGHSQAVAFSMKDYGGDAGDISPTLRSGAHDKSHANAGAPPAVAFTVSERANSFAWEGAVNPTLNAHPHSDTSGLQYGVRLGSAVRRLTPLECERLQGFPDDFTLVPYRKGKMADGPRYKMLGNSMAVPVLRWIGERIKTVEDLCAELGLAA